MKVLSKLGTPTPNHAICDRDMSGKSRGPRPKGGEGRMIHHGFSSAYVGFS